MPTSQPSLKPGPGKGKGKGKGKGLPDLDDVFYGDVL
jgi:hypothetical protein